MENFGFRIRCVLSLLAMAGVSACGGGRELVGVSVNPTSADAQNFSNGQVQFVATGTFSQSPVSAQLSGNDISWCIGSASGSCNGNIASGATVDSNGLAACVLGFQGTVTVLAGRAKMAQVNPDSAYPLAIYGTAQLTCP